jgi:hypothetical protein
VDFNNVLTPVNQSFTSVSPLVDQSTTIPMLCSEGEPQRWHVFLPTSLVHGTVASTSSVETKWRARPRQRFTVQFSFSSHKGKRRFRDLVRRREKKEKKRDYDRAYRARLKQAREQDLGSSDGTKGMIVAV